MHQSLKSVLGVANLQRLSKFGIQVLNYTQKNHKNISRPIGAGEIKLRDRDGLRILTRHIINECVLSCC